MAFQVTITDAGRAAIVNAENTGTAPVTIASIGFTNQYVPGPWNGLTVLAGQFKTLNTVGGQAVADDTIHVTVSDTSADTYSLLGFGLYLADGTLFAVYSQADPIIQKAAAAMALLAVDIKFADIAASSIAFGATDWLNPPATTDTPGVVALATLAEAIAGVLATKAVTPAGLMAALDALVTWAAIPGKPATFPPSPHTHAAGDIVSGILSLARLPIGTSGAAVPQLDQNATFSGDVQFTGQGNFNSKSNIGVFSIGNIDVGARWQLYPLTNGASTDLRFWVAASGDTFALHPDGTASLPKYGAGILQVGANGLLTTAPGLGVFAGASGAHVLTLENTSNGSAWTVYPTTDGAGSDLRFWTASAGGDVLKVNGDGTVSVPFYAAGLLQVGANGVLSTKPGLGVFAGASGANVLQIQNTSNATTWDIYPSTDGASSDLGFWIASAGDVLKLKGDGTVALPKYAPGLLQVLAGGLLSVVDSSTIGLVADYFYAPSTTSVHTTSATWQSLDNGIPVAKKSAANKVIWFCVAAIQNDQTSSGGGVLGGLQLVYDTGGAATVLGTPVTTGAVFGGSGNKSDDTAMLIAFDSGTLPKTYNLHAQFSSVSGQYVSLSYCAIVGIEIWA